MSATDKETAQKVVEKTEEKGSDHPLETPWTLYFDKKLAQQQDYKQFLQNLIKLGTFDTLEGFWRHYSYMTAPGDLPKDHDLFLFRNSYIPAWETFPNGGCWIIKVRKHNGVINRLWEELLFACVGEFFAEPDLVGVVLSTRARDDMLSIWHRDSSKSEVRFKIGERLKEILNLDESTQIEYKFFRFALQDGSTYRNAKAFVYAAAVDQAATNKQTVNTSSQSSTQTRGARTSSASSASLSTTQTHSTSFSSPSPSSSSAPSSTTTSTSLLQTMNASSNS
eukprot:TRINITY_DN7744_c0_g1_i1.p1 TRINITY_DN7744_c0_g1~~TRINITY_DN7744_c0_g1_i1.p1  ORF type:complete len:303 (+),score=57.48 TRINITY_DN7744_c0_g1_i1:71-910(+)